MFRCGRTRRFDADAYSTPTAPALGGCISGFFFALVQSIIITIVGVISPVPTELASKLSGCGSAYWTRITPPEWFFFPYFLSFSRSTHISHA